MVVSLSWCVFSITVLYLPYLLWTFEAFNALLEGLFQQGVCQIDLLLEVNIEGFLFIHNTEQDVREIIKVFNRLPSFLRRRRFMHLINDHKLFLISSNNKMTDLIYSQCFIYLRIILTNIC